MIKTVFFIVTITVFSSMIAGARAVAKLLDSLPARIFNITFRLDLSNELKNVQSLSSIGIRGNTPPLNWNKTLPMTVTNKAGLYEAMIPFATPEPTLRIEYKYFHDTASWEKADNRIIIVKNSKTVLPADHWNFVPRVNTRAYHDSLEALELYNTVIALDSLLFTSYNNCDLDIHGPLFAEDVEFYHDKGGLSTGRKGLVEAVKNNICGKVRRELVKGSIEVSAIPGYGAVETGEHRFYNIKEQSLSRPGKFTIIWRKKDGKWEVTTVISLH